MFSLLSQVAEFVYSYLKRFLRRDTSNALHNAAEEFSASQVPNPLILTDPGDRGLRHP